MANFLGVLIKSIKAGESVKHQFMGEYGVVISIFNQGNLTWVESTWGMGLKELHRVIQWGGGRFTSKSVPLEDRNKKNIEMDKKSLLSTLLNWETQQLGLCNKVLKPQTEPEPDILQALHDFTPGRLAETHEPVTGASIGTKLKNLDDGKFTGFLRISGKATGLVLVVGGKMNAAVALKQEGPVFGKDAADWLGQQVDLKMEVIKGDLFTSTCFAVPMLPHARTTVKADKLEDLLKKTQMDINGLYLLHMHVNQAHAFGLIYREVYAGTVARKKGETISSVLPMAVLTRLSMLPGAKLEVYRAAVPVD